MAPVGPEGTVPPPTLRRAAGDLVADGAVEAALLAVEALRSEGSACSAAPLPGLAEVRRAVSQAQCTVVYYGVLARRGQGRDIWEFGGGGTPSIPSQFASDVTRGMLHRQTHATRA